MAIRFCCAVCPHEVTCYDVAEAVFADPDDFTEGLSDDE